MGWIFAAVVLILLVVSPGFRKTAGGLVAAIVLFAVVVQVHDHYEKKAEAEAAEIAAAQQEPDPCAALESRPERMQCWLSEP
jgi:Skp family chaperone for outer membrane proteins